MKGLPYLTKWPQQQRSLTVITAAVGHSKHTLLVCLDTLLARGLAIPDLTGPACLVLQQARANPTANTWPGRGSTPRQHRQTPGAPLSTGSTTPYSAPGCSSQEGRHGGRVGCFCSTLHAAQLVILGSTQLPPTTRHCTFIVTGIGCHCDRNMAAAPDTGGTWSACVAACATCCHVADTVA